VAQELGEAAILHGLSSPLSSIVGDLDGATGPRLIGGELRLPAPIVCH
jgi:hypothetical protein